MNIPKEILLAVILDYLDYLNFQKMEITIATQRQKIQASFLVRMVGMNTKRAKVEVFMSWLKN